MGDSFGSCSRSYAARLGMPNQFPTIDGSPSQFKANLWQLSRLTRASLTADNHHLV
jgi:hypothetical protein